MTIYPASRSVGKSTDLPLDTLIRRKIHDTWFQRRFEEGVVLCEALVRAQLANPPPVYLHSPYRRS